MLVSMDDGMVAYDNTPAHNMYIYPSCNNTLATGNVRNLLNETVPNTTKFDAINVLSQGNNFSVLSDETDRNWPLNINIVNDAVSNNMFFLFENGNRSVSCIFSDTFDSQQDFVLAISNDRGETNHSKEIDIYAISVNRTAPNSTTTDLTIAPTNGIFIHF